MASEPFPSATVVVLRDGSAGIEVLLLERVPGADGKPGPSVFPGGRVEPVDRGEAGLDDAALRRAGVREAREEAGLELAPDALLPLSRWITPEISPRRFDTWFYLASVPREAPVHVDGGEIARHHWLGPAAALGAHHRHELRLAPPTFVTVCWLLDLRSTRDARERLGPAPLVTFRPRICRLEDGACMLYPGDAGYEAGEPAAPGPRHRLWTLPSGWRYERGLMARYAQTNLQLYAELLGSAYAEGEVGRVAAAYELAARLFSARLRGSGKPFLCHLVGTASVLASLRAPAGVVAAGLLHAAYAQGEFGSGRPGISGAKRAVLRGAIGEPAEALVARFTELAWDERSIPALLAGAGALGPRDRDVVLIRLANELEDFLDLGALYGANAEADRQWAKAVGPACAELARCLGFPALAEELARTLEETQSARIPALLQRRERASYLLAPQSHRRRARVVVAELLTRAAAAAARARRRASRLFTP